MRESGRRPTILDLANGCFWQFAILTAAGTVGASTQADATLYYWNGPDSAYYGDPEPMPLPHRPKVRRNPTKTNKDVVASKETAAKPQGPLIIAISIEQQKVRIYDANGLYAESPVSTGMKGHSTPMGVFSVIQKQKYHRSNIYSGAPMPYMQRITWSGIAMHAGVLPGYPASHGCIRMPTGFAIKMYNWTRMGARVVVTPGTITPENFSHPLLVTQKVTPQQPVADDLLKQDAPLGVKSDKRADKPQTSLELRSTVGHADQPDSLRDNTHTADASGTAPSASASVTMSDAPFSMIDKPGKPAGSGANAAKSGGSMPASQAAAVSDDNPVGDHVEGTNTEVSANDHVKAEAKAAAQDAARTKLAGADAPKVDATSKGAPVTGAATATDEPAATADTPDAKKDPARLPGLANLDVPKRGGQIAVFISRKDSKLYVRQNFAPLFDVPVTIAPSDRPLGTHIFTAEADKKDPNVLRWSVISLPVSTRNAARIEAQDRASHRRKMAGAATIEAKPLPDSPAEALDRITIPADAMARINEALGTGGSIIVSDLGVNQGETGEGTDFIVPLR
ncbi:L,D-transpeptidase family protein [Bradyrhizobium sp. ORS 111]|uniref:L,D-transpeptidase family protein n=1 Tax=Bradyrhizobium sp. ORS 111 TaxID=1685958 RepID=UPI003890E6EE